MTQMVAAALAGLVARGVLDADPAQDALAAKLDERLAPRRRRGARGLYVWGEAGRGKTLLMDLFFRAAAEPRKRRVHFHAFMAEVHDRLGDHREGREQPIVALARALAGEARLLCLDEIQVKDIADATLLGRLFATLVEQGTTIVGTSNAAPDRLYANGLNRELFLPFVRLIEERFDVVRLDAARDFRLSRLTEAGVWRVPPDRAAMDAAFARLAGNAEGGPERLRIKGRDILVPAAAHGAARFRFADLCEAPLGATDFRAIAQHFHTVFVDGVPQLDGRNNDAARRFVLLIDEFYEHRVKLVASAEAAPEDLLTEGPLAWEFRRTRSRLAEMGTAGWLALPHGRTT